MKVSATVAQKGHHSAANWAALKGVRTVDSKEQRKAEWLAVQMAYLMVDPMEHWMARLSAVR